MTPQVAGNGLWGMAPPIVLSEGIRWASCEHVASDLVGCESGARESVLLMNPCVCLHSKGTGDGIHGGCGVGLRAFKFCLCCFLAGWPWVSYFTSLCLRFLLCKMWLVVLLEVLVNIK